MNWSDISGEYYDYTETMEPEKPYNYDYSKTMTMKLLLSVPTQDGGTKVDVYKRQMVCHEYAD